MRWCRYIWFFALLLCSSATAIAQQGVNDTIRLGALEVDGKVWPFVYMPEYEHAAQGYNDADRLRRNRLRRDIYVVYPYAITAAAILRGVDSTMDAVERRRDRRKYLRAIDKQLDVAFKKPLKNLTIDQGHVLVKLINRQTGRNCYSIIKELKSGFSATIWQSVGLMFNNNLKEDYDPTGDDREMEAMVQILEASAHYKYQLYLQSELMKKIPGTVAN
jgi:hypothetical protein